MSQKSNLNYKLFGLLNDFFEGIEKIGATSDKLVKTFNKSSSLSSTVAHRGVRGLTWDPLGKFSKTCR
jgi:hypothetical protein